jgi:hypothetical protein
MDIAANAQLYSFHVYFVGSKVSSQKRCGLRVSIKPSKLFFSISAFGTTLSICLDVTTATKKSVARRLLAVLVLFSVRGSNVKAPKFVKLVLGMYR